MEYAEYVIKFTCNYFNRKWNFAQRFLEFYSFRALESGRTLTAITHHHVTYFLKAALQIVALGLLTTQIPVTKFFFESQSLSGFPRAGHTYNV